MEKLVPPFLDQHAADLVSPTEFVMLPNARRFENWEQHFAGKAGLGVAIDYALEWGLDSIRDRIYGLSNRLRSELDALDGVETTDLGKEKCGIVTFRTEQADAGAIKKKLHDDRINVTVADGSGSLVSFQQRGISEAVRASVHYFNTDREIDYFLDSLKNILATG